MKKAVKSFDYERNTMLTREVKGLWRNDPFGHGHTTFGCNIGQRNQGEKSKQTKELQARGDDGQRFTRRKVATNTERTKEI
jgi:hypothetical protein